MLLDVFKYFPDDSALNLVLPCLVSWFCWQQSYASGTGFQSLLQIERDFYPLSSSTAFSNINYVHFISLSRSLEYSFYIY